MPGSDYNAMCAQTCNACNGRKFKEEINTAVGNNECSLAQQNKMQGKFEKFRHSFYNFLVFKESQFRFQFLNRRIRLIK